jgi:hypothetical protein
MAGDHDVVDQVVQQREVGVEKSCLGHADSSISPSLSMENGTMCFSSDRMKTRSVFIIDVLRTGNNHQSTLKTFTEVSLVRMLISYRVND